MNLIWPSGRSSFLALGSTSFLKIHRCSVCVCVFVYIHTHTRRTHIGNVIPKSVSVVDRLGLPERPFKRKLLKDDYRIETPSFKSARGKRLWKLWQRGTEKEPRSPWLLRGSLRTRPPLPSPSVSHLIRERAAVRLLIYLMKIRFGMALIKTSWLSPAVALHGGNCSEALCVGGCHGWHRSKWHFFNKYI